MFTTHSDFLGFTPCMRVNTNKFERTSSRRAYDTCSPCINKYGLLDFNTIIINGAFLLFTMTGFSAFLSHKF